MYLYNFIHACAGLRVTVGNRLGENVYAVHVHVLKSYKHHPFTMWVSYNYHTWHRVMGNMSGMVWLIFPFVTGNLQS